MSTKMPLVSAPNIFEEISINEGIADEWNTALKIPLHKKECKQTLQLHKYLPPRLHL